MRTARDFGVDVAVDEEHGDFLVLSFRPAWPITTALVATPISGSNPQGDSGIVVSKEVSWGAWSPAPVAVRGGEKWLMAWHDADGVELALLDDDERVERRGIVLAGRSTTRRLILVRTSGGFALIATTSAREGSRLLFLDADGYPLGMPQELRFTALDAAVVDGEVAVVTQPSCAGANCAAALQLERARGGAVSAPVNLALDHPSSDADRTVRLVSTTNGLVLLRTQYPAGTAMELWRLNADDTLRGPAVSLSLPGSNIHRIWAMATASGVRGYHFSLQALFEFTFEDQILAAHEVAQVDAGGDARQVAIGLGTDRSLVVHHGGQAFLTEAGTSSPAAGFIALLVAAKQENPTVVRGESAVLIAWAEERPQRPLVRARILNDVPGGDHALGPILDLGAGLGPTAAASGGGVFLVGYEDRVARLGADGTRFSDIVLRGRAQAIAFDGAAFHVFTTTGSMSPRIEAIRISPDGSVLDPLPRLVRDAPAFGWIGGAAAETSEGAPTLLVWMETAGSCGKGCTRYDVKGEAFDHSGAGLGTFTISSDEDLITFPEAPLITRAGDSWIVGWSELRASKLQRVSGALQNVERSVLLDFPGASRIARVNDGIVVVANSPRFPYRVVDAQSLEVRREGFLLSEYLSADPAIAPADDQLWTAWISPLWYRPFSGSLQILAARMAP